MISSICHLASRYIKIVRLLSIVIAYLLILIVSGDAIREDWKQCIHFGLPISFYCCPSFCCGASKCNPKAEIGIQNNPIMADVANLNVLKPCLVYQEVTTWDTRHYGNMLLNGEIKKLHVWQTMLLCKWIYLVF